MLIQKSIYTQPVQNVILLEVCHQLNAEGIKSRVVSLMSWELFNKQDAEYQKAVIGNAKLNVSIEAGSSFGWERFIGRDGLSISIDRFGLSGKGNDLKQYFGFDKNKVLFKIKTALSAMASSTK